MRCKKAQQLIHLNRPGEVSSQDQIKLKHHLEKCHECAKHQQQVQKTENQYRTLMNLDLKPKDGKKLTENIINEIKSLKRPRSYNLHSIWSNDILNQFAKFKVRIAITSLALLITAGFILQEIIILHKIAALEKQMADQSKNHHEFDVIFYKREVLEKSLWSEILVQDHGYIDQLPNDFILIDKETFKEFITDYANSRIKNRLLSAMIKETDLNSLFNRALNESEMKDKLTIKMKKRELIKWIHKL